MNERVRSLNRLGSFWAVLLFYETFNQGVAGSNPAGLTSAIKGFLNRPKVISRLKIALAENSVKSQDQGSTSFRAHHSYRPLHGRAGTNCRVRI
jgi:hypothetical protein